MAILGLIPAKDFMTKDPLTLQSTATVAEAYELMRNHRIRHLPVLDGGGRLVGVFTERDLHHAYAPRETAEGWYYDKDEMGLLVARHFMTEDPVTLRVDSTFFDAVDIFTRNKFGGLPVVSLEGKLLGIVSYIDILKTIKRFLTA
ncbi:MAG: CBS domain-containing protein [Candidatus Omnitrophota bacterium]